MNTRHPLGAIVLSWPVTDIQHGAARRADRRDLAVLQRHARRACNSLTTGADPTPWEFADSVHPTTGGHRVIKAAFAAALQSFGWI
jgi:hypothetical protein